MTRILSLNLFDKDSGVTSSLPEPRNSAPYSDLLAQIKAQVLQSRVQAARKINTELITMYWNIGRLILDRQTSEGWGSKVIDQIAADLRAEFPGMRGSPRAASGI